jgi:hypothetical protein
MDQNNGKRNYVSVWICQIFFVFFNKLFLEHEDIINNSSLLKNYTKSHKKAKTKIKLFSLKIKTKSY